jgi:ribosomal protein S18 acetylase RimI-like enzyme
MNAVLAIEHVSFARDAYPESLFRLYAADRRSLFLVAHTGDGPALQTAEGVVGYIIARMDRWGAEIVSLAVDPKSRNRGVGRTLLNAAVRRMRRKHAQSIRLMVHVNNANAASFYRRQGFRPVGRVTDYYEDGGTAIRMRLQLGPDPGSGREIPQRHRRRDLTSQ